MHYVYLPPLLHHQLPSMAAVSIYSCVLELGLRDQTHFSYMTDLEPKAVLHMERKRENIELL